MITGNYALGAVPKLVKKGRNTKMQIKNRSMMKNGALVSGLLLMASLVGSTQALAQGAIEIGGRTAITANFGVTTQNPDETAGVDIETSIVNLGTNITRTTDDGRWEYGAGFTVTAIIIDIDSDAFSDKTTVTLFTPSAQVRINTDLLGAEENFLVYAGFIAGVTIADYDSFDDEVGAFGPKFGAEYYFSQNMAVQLEDALLFDTEKGITNTLSLGIKLLF